MLNNTLIRLICKYFDKTHFDNLKACMSLLLLFTFWKIKKKHNRRWVANRTHHFLPLLGNARQRQDWAAATHHSISPFLEAVYGYTKGICAWCKKKQPLYKQQHHHTSKCKKSRLENIFALLALLLLPCYWRRCFYSPSS